MDVKREGVAKRKTIKLWIVIGLIVLAAPLITYGLSRLKPAAPTVEGGTLWPGTVKRGMMERNVRGLGTLVPEDILFIPTQFEGRVDSIKVRAGTEVRPETILVVLSNPDMELAANDLEWQVKQAEATFADLKVKLQSIEIEQKSLVSRALSEFTQAKLTKERDDELAKLGLKPEIESRLSSAKFDDARSKYDNEQEKLKILTESTTAQLASQNVQIEKLKASYDLKRKQVSQLIVKAGNAGILQEMDPPLQIGQRVTANQVLAKVVQPWKLKADLKIAETQAKDVSLGQTAQIDTRNGVIPGRVVRKDPSAVNGTVTVSVRLEGDLPPGAVPDLSVDGVILIERLDNVVYVERPVFGQPNATASIFKYDADMKGATRTKVKFGRSSVSTIEIVDGLKVGDKVILSDMSQWDSQERIRVN
jgi:HlyD family secretion protein